MEFKYPEDKFAIIEYLEIPSIQKELESELMEDDLLTEEAEY